MFCGLNQCMGQNGKQIIFSDKWSPKYMPKDLNIKTGGLLKRVLLLYIVQRIFIPMPFRNELVFAKMNVLQNLLGIKGRKGDICPTITVGH